MTAPKKEISLLPNEEDVNSLPSRILKWVSTVGRFVIVFTELIVISAFISRFWLDRKNSDLSEVIRQQKAILESTQEFEKEYNVLYQKLKYIKNFYSNQPQYEPDIQSIVESTPPEIIYNRLTLDRSESTGSISATLSLIAYKESAIVDFITNLTLNPRVQSVDIKNIEKKPKENNYSINLLLNFKKT